MSISHTYSYKRFDPVNATLTVLGTSTDSATGTTLTFTRVLPLPVNSSGSVPTGAALTAYVETFLDGLIKPDLDRKAALAPFGGEVSNKADMFTLTTDVEAGEVLGIPVQLIADQDFRNPITNQTTRSIITVSNLDEFGYGLDNGNVNNATITNIVSSGFADIAGPISLSLIYDVPQKYIDSYGNGVFGSHQSDVSFPAFRGEFYYVEHAPIQMYNAVTALFHYS